MSENISYKQEILRKLIHLSTLWVPVSYHFFEKPTMLWLVGIILLIVLFADIGRHHLRFTGRMFDLLFGNMLRPHEKHEKKLSGASLGIFACLVTILLFEKPVAIAAISIMVIADALAALVGRKIGTIKLMGKSLQGTLTFLFSALAINWGVGALYGTPHSFWFAAVFASIVATLAELFSKHLKVDDNFTIPLSYGIVMQGLLLL